MRAHKNRKIQLAFEQDTSAYTLAEQPFFQVSTCQYWKAYIREQQNDKQNMTELTYPAVI